MSADLSSRSLVNRMSLVLMDDSLVKLQHGGRADRVNRYAYADIESVIIWQKTPWGRLILYTVLFGLPGLLVMIFNVGGSLAAYVTGGILLGVNVVVGGWVLYCRVTTIRVIWARKTSDFCGLFRPGKLKAFEQRLLSAIQQRQTQTSSNETPVI